MTLSQTDRVERVLRMRDTYGTTVNDWDRGPGVPAVDGGERITRLAARIKDLQDRGLNVQPIEKREGFTVYALLPSKPVAEVRPTAFRLPAFVIDTTDGPVSIELEVLHPGWTITSRGYERTSNVGGGEPSSLADATPETHGVALDGPPPPTPSDERTAA